MGNKLTIENNRQHFWQWDVGQRLIVEDADCQEVHFYNGGEGALKQDVYVEGGVTYVNVPDILLQSARGLEAFLYVAGTNAARTLVHQHIDVCPRPRPLEYAYTPTEILSWQAMDAKMNELLEEIGKSDYSVVQNSLKEISDQLSDNTRQHGEMEAEILAISEEVASEISAISEEVASEIAGITGEMERKVSVGLTNETRFCSTDEEIQEAMEAFFQASVVGGLTCFSLSVDSSDVSTPFHSGRFAMMIFRDTTAYGDFGLCMLVDTATSLGGLICRRNEYGWDNRWEYRGVTPIKGIDYWTAKDKADIVSSVIAALPVYGGEVE